ncbi:uncharacterized protein LOC123684325 isoform X2 [Harmonia axyridis]|uniref:uncharacterized protein LOC123684325 isoform X2 n=1 Tax=Harmonia axyridis TaxID=115357 RepID=UPI001E275EBA|nr:uncharacterized protein LOC123684325 isoform X2 [Harmonia axyridis]
MCPRRNISSFVVLLLSITSVVGFIEVSYQNGYISCETNETSPIYFRNINLTQYREIQLRSHDITNGRYVCDLGDDARCDPWWTIGAWRKKHSIEEPLKDERWEDLEVHQLENKYSNGSIKYTKLWSMDTETKIYISLSISPQTELYFCNKDNVQDSRCLLMTISKDVKVQDSGIISSHPSTELNDVLWADGKWRNFLWKINRENGSIEFTEYNNVKNKIFKVPNFNPIHLFGRSEGSKDFVKIHSYYFLQTKETGIHQIGPPFHITGHFICISLYVSMCKNCKMIFMMDSNIIAEVNSSEKGKWRKIFLKIYHGPETYEQLYVYTVVENTTYYKFWALDHVQLCPDSSRRSMKLKGQYSCEHVTNAGTPPEINVYFHHILSPFEIVQSFGEIFTMLTIIDSNGIFVLHNYDPSANITLRPINSICFKKMYSICKKISDVSCEVSLNLNNFCETYIYLEKNGKAINLIKYSLGKEDLRYNVSSAPHPLNFRDYYHNNSFQIQWTHPSINSRYLTDFEIKIISRSRKVFQLKKPIEKLKRTYNIVVDNMTYESCSEYFIQVIPINEFGPGFAATILEVFPPFLPSIAIKREEFEEKVVYTIEPFFHLCGEKMNFSHNVFILFPDYDINKRQSEEIVALEKKLGKKFPKLYRVLQEMPINQSVVNFHHSVYVDNNGQLLFLEVITYGSMLKYYEHNSYAQNIKHQESGIEIALLDIPFYMGILSAAAGAMCCWWCCSIIKTSMRRRTKTKLVRRQPTIDHIYFEDDEIKLMDGPLIEMRTFKPTRRPKVEIPEDTSGLSPIRINKFERYVKQSITDNNLVEQFESLPMELTEPCEVGKLDCNKPKNRFPNILPYDHTRVKLQILKGKKGNDYINANYIKGYKNCKAFIAAQGPKSLTINDFWHMVWQENVKNIIMLVNLEESGVKKVEKYWPGHNEDFEFGKVHIYHHTSETLADYEIRVFRLVCDGSERKVFQYHYQNWPDNGIPAVLQTSVRFFRKTMEIQSKSPTLVHCCSGTSATGVFILSHLCVQMAQQTGSIDVLKVAKELRKQRVNMIHNYTQYKFAHLLIVECLFGLQATIYCNDEVDVLVARYTEPEKLRLQMMYLEDLSWQYKALEEFPSYDYIYTIYPNKNKVQHIFPDISGAVILDRYPDEDLRSSYINAIKVDGYQCSQRFIVTQQPMSNTLNDFWRMIHQKNVRVIVSLNDINLKDMKSCTFWPTEENPLMSPVDFIFVRHCLTVKEEIYDVYEVQVSIQEKQKKAELFKVTIVELKGWKQDAVLPDCIKNFLRFTTFVNSITRCLKPVVVTCYDGCLASGVYVAASYLVEMIEVQKSFDVCNTVRTIRKNRKQFITDEKQLAFLYEVSAVFIRGYQHYANFTECSERFSNCYDQIQIH